MLAIDIRFEDYVNILPYPTLVVEKSGHILFVNDQAYEYFDIERDSNNNSLHTLLDNEKVKVERYLNLCSRTINTLPYKFSIKKNGKESVSCMVSGARIYNSKKLPSSDPIVLICEPIEKTDQQKSFNLLNNTIDKLKKEIKLRKRSELLLQAEKEVLAKIVSGASIENALKLLVKTIEKNNPKMHVSILSLNEDNSLHHLIATTLPDAYTKEINGLRIGANVGSCGTAAFTGKTVVVSDVNKDSRWINYRELAQKFGFKSCWSTPIITLNNKVLGTFAVYFYDVTDASEFELYLLESSARIACMAMERHQSEQNEAKLLENEKKERKRIEDESNAKDYFLATLSHEIRNPLGAISNASYALNELENTDSVRKNLQAILIEESQNLKHILNDLLDIARLNSGKILIKTEPLDMALILRKVIGILRETYPDKTIECRYIDDIGWIKGDPIRIQQIIKNLIDNAIKFSSKNESIILEATSNSDDILMHVIDRGKGIDPDLLPDIFEPFSQFGRSQSNPNNGLGLGLALVKQFTELHGGSISVISSGIGNGSKFTVRLPRIMNPEVSEPLLKQRVEFNTTYNILIIEDHDNIRDAMCRLLRLKGHRVSAAANGEEGLEIMHENPPDIAFVDIGLPCIDGYEVAKRVRSELSSANIKLVALTGYGQESDRKKVFQAGFSLHLVKPVSMNDIYKVFEELGKAA